MSALAFVDTETTGLDPDRNEVWEVALILRDPEQGEDQEYLWQLPVDLSRADSIALTIGQFYERRWNEAGGLHFGMKGRVWDGEPEEKFVVKEPYQWAMNFARLTSGAHLVGAVPDFDSRFLTKTLRQWGACPGWHYHLIDVEALLIGWSRGKADWTEPDDLETPPWNSRELYAAHGFEWEGEHTALGDARLARAVYDRVMTWK